MNRIPRQIKINHKNMKPGLLIIAFFTQLSVIAQSPYLSFILKMDSAKSIGIHYKIEMKICEPKKKTKIGNWGSHEVSKINFDLLKAKDINCGYYFEKGLPALISGQEKEIPINQFEYGNQLFGWEHIFIFRISNISSRGVMPDMYLVMPMKYKSFFTTINLSDLVFESGKVLCLTQFNHLQDGNKLHIDQSLENYKTVDEKKFFLKEILETK